MKSKLHCEFCKQEKIHYKKDAGPWFYKVCESCGKEKLLLDNIWDEFKRNEIKE